MKNWKSLGLPEPVFNSNTVFSSKNKSAKNDVIVTNFTWSNMDFEFDEKKAYIESQIEKEQDEIINQFLSELPDDKSFKHWSDMMHQSSYWTGLYEKCVLNRDYESLR